MVSRQLKEKEFTNFTNELMKYAHWYPMEAHIDVDLVFNNQKYILRLQPDKHCKIVALQALSILYDKTDNSYSLITDNQILLAMLDLLIYQGIKGHNY